MNTEDHVGKPRNRFIGGLAICLSITGKTNTVFVYDVNGNNKGKMVSSVDYAKNTAE